MKTAFITGITGQDGSYLAELLLNKGYEVHGLKRRSSINNTERIDKVLHIHGDDDVSKRLIVHHGDMTDSGNIFRLIHEIGPDEVYNLAAQSHVAVSFELPEYTANVDALGTLRILEAIRSYKKKKIRLYQASTSELYGDSVCVPQNEMTPFNPRSPYAIAKLYSFWIVKNYREAYGMFAVNGILFNHESERRGITFVTRKITSALVRIKLGIQKTLRLGNLDSKRDWGHAEDYVEAMWLMLQSDSSMDLVISTGYQITVREFVQKCCDYLDMSIEWKGESLNEVGIINGTIAICVDPAYFRPTEVNNLLGDSTLAREILNWQPKVGIDELVKRMIDNDLNLLK